MSTKATQQAAAAGRFEVLKWLHEEAKCPWEADNCLRAALRSGNKPLIDYMADAVKQEIVVKEAEKAKATAEKKEAARKASEAKKKPAAKTP